MVYTSVGHIIYIDRGGYPQNLSTVNVKILCDEYSISFVKNVDYNLSAVSCGIRGASAL